MKRLKRIRLECLEIGELETGYACPSCFRVHSVVVNQCTRCQFPGSRLKEVQGRRVVYEVKFWSWARFWGPGGVRTEFISEGDGFDHYDLTLKPKEA